MPDDLADDGGEPFGVYAPYRMALIAVLAERAAQGGGTRLEALARMVVAQAEAGDREALREIVDRLDGRPFANEGPARPPRKVVFGWKDAFDKPARFPRQAPARAPAEAPLRFPREAPRFGTELARRLKDN